MSINMIDAKAFQKMFLAGAKRLEANKEWINELNVFPVPDGDTGTNMTLTITAAAKEISSLKDPTIEELCKAISFGSLRGARGNSGVILSQLLRGMAKGIGSHEKIDVKVCAKAFQKAVESAYKAVMRPKEGTILTVARGAAEKASDLLGKTNNLESFLEQVILHAEEVLQKTPDMLPVLKQAGVIDAGGQGLIELLKGGYDAFLGKEVELYTETAPDTSAITINKGQSSQDITFGYCTEFIVMLDQKLSNTKEDLFKSYLESIGDSVVVVSDVDIVKVHVHTNDPGLAIQKGLSHGSLTSMKIDNMREQHQENIQLQEKEKEPDKEPDKIEKSLPQKEVGFIAVSIGDGIDEIFNGLGVDYLIKGGQTMNPSTEDMLNAIEQVNAKSIFILPNNSNIILVANQAQQLVNDKKIIVISTKTIPQGIMAIISYIPDKTLEENEQRMLEDIKKVKTGHVTYAVRNTNVDGKDIKENDIMGIGDQGILSVGNSITETTMQMLEQLLDEDSELVSIYYGEDVSEAEATDLREQLESKYTSCDFEVQFGGQPIYYYIISVE